MADHSYLWFVLAGLVVGRRVVWWKYRDRLPASDWAFTVDVDRHLPPLADGSQIAERFWSAVLVEKVVLLTLISVIFAQIMPDIRASNLGVALGVAVLVVLNAAISQFLGKRGHSWSSSARQFLAMLVINAGIVTVDAILGRRRQHPRAEHVVLRRSLVASHRTVRPLQSDARTQGRPDGRSRQPSPSGDPDPMPESVPTADSAWESRRLEDLPLATNVCASCGA